MGFEKDLRKILVAKDHAHMYVILQRCILPTLRVLLCIKTLVGHVMCKRLITVPFESSELFYLLRLMGVSVPSLHIESTDSMIQSVDTTRWAHSACQLLLHTPSSLCYATLGF